MASPARARVRSGKTWTKRRWRARTSARVRIGEPAKERKREVCGCVGGNRCNNGNNVTTQCDRIVGGPRRGEAQANNIDEEPGEYGMQVNWH